MYSKMLKNHISFIIIPHHKGKQKTFSLSKRNVRIILGTTCFVVLALSAVLVHYGLMTGINQKYKTLLQETVSQTEKFVQYEQTILSLQTTILNFEEYAKKLNIMAGLKASEVLNMEAGVGSGLTDGQSFGFIPPPQETNLRQLDEISKTADRVNTNLNSLLNIFDERAVNLAYTPTIKPTNGYISSPYGYRDDPFTGKRTFHWGIDIVTAEGNPVVATADGTVIVRQANDKISGNYIKISHPLSGYVTIYCHLSEFKVKNGQKVKRGETIGLVGSTGKSNGPHVHYEVQLDGKPKNPWLYLLEE
ncbi:MAG: M23 family metallopeptidase [Candidatus Aminicenantes bacterium]|nr:M23 family metallopeptidase [Candidatus Aminicenantes bacterium]